MLIIMLISTASIITASGLFLTFQVNTVRKQIMIHMITLAKVVGDNTKAALLFDVKEDAEEILSGLRNESSVTAACIHTVDGKVFALFPRDLEGIHDFPPNSHEEMSRYETDHLTIVQSITHKGIALGSVSLHSDLCQVNAILKRNIVIAMSIILTTSILAFLLSHVLHKQITGPIVSLVQTTSDISQSQNYDIRVNKWSQDEIGRLYDEFNHMLEQIQIREKERNLAESRLRESEERFDLAVRGSTDGVWDWPNLESDAHWWSPRCYELIGYMPDEFEVSWSSFLKLIHPVDRSDVERRMSRHLEDRVPFDVEFRLRTKSGEYGWFRSRGQALWNDLGAPIRMAGSLQDIIDRKRAEDAREQLIVELESKNAEMEQFTYTISHDLKSPLFTIRGYLALLKKDLPLNDQDRVEIDLKRINDAASNMSKLLDDLLELSRIGRLVSPFKEVSLEELTHQVLDLVSGEIDEHSVKVKVASELSTVFGDPVRLQEVLQNLVTNAVKYMGAQPEPCIDIGVRKGGNGTVFYVRDNGIGIEPCYHERIFGLFERLDAHTDGTGIGLALVKRIIEIHHGRIWVESKGLGEGSTFCFTLPRK